MVVYCTAADVKNFVQRKRDFSDTSTPSKDWMDSIIEMHEDDINSQTGHSWKESHINKRPIQHITREGGFFVFDLGNRKIKDLDILQGDKIEVSINNIWTNILDSENGKTEGKAGDYWIDQEIGQLYLKQYTPNTNNVRVTFRFGESDVPGNIRKLAILWSAADYYEFTEQSLTHAEDGSVDRQSVSNKIDNLRRKGNTILQDVSEWKTVY